MPNKLIRGNTPDEGRDTQGIECRTMKRTSLKFEYMGMVLACPWLAKIFNQYTSWL